MVLLKIKNASVSGKDNMDDEVTCCSLYCHGVCSSFSRLKTSVQCEHLVVYDHTDIFVIITALLCYGECCSMKEEREERTWRRKVLHETLVAVQHPRRVQFSSTLRQKPEITCGSTCLLIC